MAEKITIEIPADILSEALVRHVSDSTFISGVMREALDRSGMRQLLAEELTAALRDLRQAMKSDATKGAISDAVKEMLPGLVRAVVADTGAGVIVREIHRARKG